MKKNLILSILLIVVIGASLFGGGVTENTTYAKTILERKDSVSTYFQQVVGPYSLKNGPVEMVAVPLLSETYLLSEYPDMKNKRYSTSKMIGLLESHTKALDRQQEMSGTFIVFLQYERNEEFLGLSSFTIDSSFFDYMFLDNDKSDYLGVSKHTVVRAKTVDAYNKVLEFWVTFGENEDERKEFFQNSKLISISVTDYGFENQTINYTLPLSKMFLNIPEDVKGIQSSIRGNLEVTFDGVEIPVKTGQTFGSTIGEPQRPNKKGYLFGGWYKDALYTTAWDFKKDVLLDDTMLYAKWTGNEYLANLDNQGGTGGSTSITTTFGSAMPPASAPTKGGYVFEGYYDAVNGGRKQYYTTTMASGRTWDKEVDSTLYASWRLPTVGDIGPSGGYIFYDDEADGVDDIPGYRYLEAAPAGWSGDSADPGYVFGYYRPEGTNIIVGGTDTTIGSGEVNNAALTAVMGSTAYSSRTGTEKAVYVAKICEEYTGGGNDDWFLPSKDELNLMYQNLKVQGLGGLSDYYYWSSSENDEHGAWVQGFGNGGQRNSYNRTSRFWVRPVRAF